MEKIDEKRINAKRRLQLALALLLSYAFLLTLSVGFPVTGDDWFFTTKTQSEPISVAFSRGVHVATQHYETTNGRLLGNFLSGMLGCSKLLRELVRCGVILGIVVCVCRLCEIRTGVGRVCALALLVSLPAGLFSESYAWAAGFFNYVPPVLLVLFYLLRLERGDGSSNFFYILEGALLGFAAQLFCEHVTLVLCAFSALVFAADCKRQKRVDGFLLSHLIGALAGALVMFLAPGYHSEQSAGYRDVASGLSGLLSTIETNLPVIARTLFGKNQIVILPLAACAAALLLQSKPQTKKTQNIKRASLLALLLAPVFYFCDDVMFAPLRPLSYNLHVAILALALEVVVMLAFFAAITAVFALCFEKKDRRRGFVLLALAAGLSAPFLVVSPVGPRCLYGSDVLLICVLLIFAREALRFLPLLKKAAVPALLCAITLLGSTLWVCLWNGRSERVREEALMRQMEQGQTEIVLPEFAFAQYIYEGSSQKLGEYRYYESPHDITFDFVPFSAWNGKP